jgi:outer membrane protein assembly factor BamA
VIDGYLLHRYENYLRLTTVLGGESRLRGFSSRAFRGGSAAALNFEYRTRRFELFKSVELGGVLFYDVGDAFDTWSAFSPKHDAGFGTRILFPQLDRVVFRVDVGFPIAPSLPGISPITFFATFEQAFPLDTIEPKSAVTL